MDSKIFTFSEVSQDENLILIVTNKFDLHADRVILGLKTRNIPFIRFNIEDFPQRTALSLRISNSDVLGHLFLKEKLPLSQVKSIWYRRPISFEISPSILKNKYKEFALEECNTAVGGLWHLISSCLWVNHPHCMRKAANKIYQLEVARQLGFEIPLTVITNDPLEAKLFCDQCCEKGSGVVIKTLSGTSSIPLLTRKLSSDDFQKIDCVKYAPCFLQEYIEKEFEVRVTVVGKKCFAAEIHSQTNERTKVDWRNQIDDEDLPHYPHNLPPDIHSKCVSLVENIELVFGAIDMIVTPDGRYIFLENNPNGQWLWIERLTDLPISIALVDLLIQGKVS